jgi:hypothetical protein
MVLGESGDFCRVLQRELLRFKEVLHDAWGSENRQVAAGIAFGHLKF